MGGGPAAEAAFASLTIATSSLASGSTMIAGDDSLAFTTSVTSRFTAFPLPKLSRGTGCTTIPACPGGLLGGASVLFSALPSPKSLVFLPELVMIRSLGGGTEDSFFSVLLLL